MKVVKNKRSLSCKIVDESYPFFMKKLFLFVCLVCHGYSLMGQVGINTEDPSPASILDVNSTSNNVDYGGFLPPRVNLAQRNAIPVTSDDDGLMIYLIDGTERCIQIYDAVLNTWDNVFCMPINNAPIASNVTYSGIMVDGQTLTASFNYSDIEDDIAGSHIYTWYTATDESGAGQAVVQSGSFNNFVLTNLQIGYFIAVEVTPVATTGISPGTSVISAWTGPVTEPSTFASDLFISEYIEGSSYNKAIEIANFTGSTVNLSGYKLNQYTNGNNLGTTVVNFDSIDLPHGSVYVVKNSNASPSLPANITDGGLGFNGNDVIALLDPSDSIIDLIGNIGVDTTYAQDKGLRKKPGIGPSGGDGTYNLSDYDEITPTDTFSGFGSHTY